MIFPAVEIYPCEGTETQTADRFRLLLWLKFIPVRGRKLSQNFQRCLFIWLKFIPVRGRKLDFSQIIKHDFLLKFIPVRGRKHPAHAADLINSHRVEIYPREGIETCDVKTIESSFFSNLNDKFNPKGLYKKGKMC